MDIVESTTELSLLVGYPRQTCFRRLLDFVLDLFPRVWSQRLEAIGAIIVRI